MKGYLLNNKQRFNNTFNNKQVLVFTLIFLILLLNVK